jgi:H+/Cl- antiporter ClcA
MKHDLLIYLRIWIICGMVTGLGVMLYQYVLTVTNGSPSLTVQFNGFGEWYIELIIFLPMLVLAPLYAWLDRERVMNFICEVPA